VIVLFETFLPSFRSEHGAGQFKVSASVVFIDVTITGVFWQRKLISSETFQDIGSIATRLSHFIYTWVL